MAESDATRERRQTLAGAVEEYREGLYDNDDENAVAHEVAEKWGVSLKDLRETAKAGV